MAPRNRHTHIPVSGTHGQLTELRLAPVNPRTDAGYRRRVLAEVRAAAKAKAKKGPSAARSQDFLYDEYGLPK